MNNNISVIKSKRGQASAPFEVLVAVILMGFVIIAGTWALTNLSQSTCIGDKRQNMSELKEAIRDVVLGSDLTIKNISFDTRPCLNQKYETITLTSYDSPTRCQAYCGGGENCILMEYIYDDGKTRQMPITPICMDLPTAISFETSLAECGTQYLPEDWFAMNLSSSPSPNITSGKYRLFMKSTSSNSVREMCFLKRL
ncbi:MAG: hypothetical protein WCX82_00025 [archaeon]